MSQPSSLLVDLPRIFRAITAEAPLRPMRRPYRDGEAAYATNAIVSVRMPLDLLRDDVIAKIRRKPTGTPDVDRLLSRWSGDGQSHRLPGWDDRDDRREFGPRSTARVGRTPLMRRWVGFLLDHGIRAVWTGITPDDPVRFDFLDGEAEGLLMPCEPRPNERRHPYGKGI